MSLSSFSDFFLATAGAGGALIGLLFVAISINPERTFGPDAPNERQSVAANAFTALIVAFFVSLAALLPDSNVGGISVVMAGLGILSSTRLGFQLARYHLRQRGQRTPLLVRLVRALVMVVGSVAVYGAFALAGARVLLQPSDEPALNAVAILVIVCYGLGLFRAWELLGGPRQGISGWLNPLRDLDDAQAYAASATRDSAVSFPAEAPLPATTLLRDTSHHHPH